MGGDWFCHGARQNPTAATCGTEKEVRNQLLIGEDTEI